MRNYFAPLKLKDVLTLSGWIAIGYIWLFIDQFFFENIYLRFTVMIGLMFGLLYLQLHINKPSDALHYTNTITLILLTLIISTSLIIHCIIRHDFAPRSFLLWVVSFVIPYLDCWLYLKN
jgi:hypothetical protein